jgi:uncharacterized protein (DUF1778 family)
MATRPVEDIQTVLGRFQAWTGARSAGEAGPGIREIPYEEALASERYRWKGAGRKPESAKPQVKARPGDASHAGEPEREKTRAAKIAKTIRTRGHGKGAAPDAKKAGSAKRCAAAKQELPERKPMFREVLTEAMKPSELVVAQTAELARQKAISIRLAPEERALIQARAAEAGTTVSAYMRQCVLEVEQLRAQVRKAMAAMECGGSGAMADLLAAPPPAPRFFARMARRFFPARGSVLALRA